MATKESFLMYGAWQEPIMRLSNESKGILLTALLEYHNTGREIEMPMDVQMAFLFMKKQMDMDAEKYRKTCEKRAESGKLGGLATQNKQNKANQANACCDKQNKANQADNDNENDVVVDNNTRTRATTTTPTIEKIENYRKQLANKFYIKGEDDSFCRMVLKQAREFNQQRIQDMANGNPRGFTIDGKELWEWSQRVDVAVGYRVWIERVVSAWDAGKIKGAANAA
ncbi:MAG: hypothetical protein IJ881_00695 [Neisseriaceae bacterium]|nr:hypothetical protein [Neisseriaceae bacterium]